MRPEDSVVSFASLDSTLRTVLASFSESAIRIESTLSVMAIFHRSSGPEVIWPFAKPSANPSSAIARWYPLGLDFAQLSAAS